MDISVYGFEDSDGNPSEFRTMNVIEAKEYARSNRLKLVEHVFEWTEQVPVEGYDYRETKAPPSIEGVRRSLPAIGTTVRLGRLEGFPHFLIEAGETGTVEFIDEQHTVISIKLDNEHDELEEWDNCYTVNVDFLGDDYSEITDRTERLALAFWLEVEEVIMEPGNLTPQQDDALSSVCSEVKHALSLGLPLPFIKGQLELAADEHAEAKG
tara:strand:- start:22385 stop:23017 length:633 start_codon:yes stop_codon:yes gene_type:complete